MKISKYTFFIKKHNSSCLYNTLSNSLIELDNATFEKLKELSKKKQFEESDLDEDRENIIVLKKGKFITENDTDDFLLLKATINNARKGLGVFGLTIAPTMDCNYRCHYCFEEHRKEYMNESDIDVIIKLIDKQIELKYLNITWFGGEPLMAFDMMVKFYEKLKVPKEVVHSSIITNGYYMTKEVVDFFEKTNINRVQVSIDGMGDEYNAIKYSETDTLCWDTLLKNIDYLLTKPTIATNIRVNLPNDDLDSFTKILCFFREKYPNNKNLWITPAFLVKNKITEQQNNNSFLTPRQKQTQFKLDLSQREFGKEMNLLYPSNAVAECAVRNENFFGIGPGLQLYKCWENMGNKEECFGFLDKEANVNITDPILYNRFLYGEDPFADPICQKCKYLPICVGGCPYYRLRNRYEDAQIGICTEFKEALVTYLEQRITEYSNNNK